MTRGEALARLEALGINHPEHRARALAIGEMVRRQGAAS